MAKKRFNLEDFVYIVKNLKLAGLMEHKYYVKQFYKIWNLFTNIN